MRQHKTRHSPRSTILGRRRTDQISLPGRTEPVEIVASIHHSHRQSGVPCRCLSHPPTPTPASGKLEEAKVVHVKLTGPLAEDRLFASNSAATIGSFKLGIYEHELRLHWLHWLQHTEYRQLLCLPHLLPDSFPSPPSFTGRASASPS